MFMLDTKKTVVLSEVPEMKSTDVMATAQP